MNALIEFLRARLDDDERTAREAGSRSVNWSVNGTWHLEGVEHDVVGEEEAFCHPHNVEHIARHDPARVLREVDAKRRILELYDVSTSRELKLDAWELMKHAVRALALPYADHPDYDESWRP